MKQILAAACAVTLALVLLSVTPMQAQRAAGTPDFLPDPGNSARGLALSQRFESASVVTFARSQGAGIAVGAPRAAAATRASSFFNAHGSAFGIANAASVRAVQQSAPDEIGVEHVRFQQLHDGIPVVAGQVIVHLKGDYVIGANAEVLADTLVNTNPDLLAGEAVDKARALIDKVQDAATAADVSYSAPRLEVLNRGLLEPGSYPTRLTWFIEAKALAVREFIWVDAHTGGVILHFSQLTSAKNRQVYDAQSFNALPGTLVRSEGSASSGDVDVDAAYNYSGDTYDYYLTQHGRDSFDNAGGTLISSVRYCEFFLFCPYANAFWNGSQMVYGAGFAAADDADAHELTHAVTERTANLLYYMQSGALNESFSDIFGETVDLTNAKGNDAAAVRWKIGEDLPASVGIIRDMMTPTNYGDPGKISDPQFATDYSADNGGVHTNSGVPNHGFALMVDGGTYNGKTVTGIGLTAAGKIQYRALTVYLTSGSNFIDDYNALQQACTDLIGVAGITSSTCVQVKNALDAVELNGTWPFNTPAPALCSSGPPTSTLFLDDFETTVNPNWSTLALQGTGMWVVPDTGWAKSGTRMAWGQGFDVVTDTVLSMKNSIALPAGAKLQFNHAYSFEQLPNTFVDGGVVEYSTNGGGSWIDAGSLIAAGDNYRTTPIYTGSDNPIEGRRAFAGDSYGYTASQLDLSSLAGSSVRFRFRLGTDTGTGSTGWVVDDVRLYTCTSVQTCTYSISPTSTTVQPTGGTGSVAVTASSGTCGWTATSNAPSWITINSGASGTGNGTVSYTVAAYTGKTNRTGTLTIAGKTFTVTQLKKKGR
jgi:Zn-dependent metalloprotease